MTSSTGSYPDWIFDGSPIADPLGYGQRAIDFLSLLKHPKSRLPGQAFDLPEWQERIVRAIYGLCHPDGRRIVRTVVILLPRGNRKTSLGAALGLLHTAGPEKQPGGQAIFAAVDKEQARIAYEEALGIIDMDPRFAKLMRLVDSKNLFEHKRTDASLVAISSDASKRHGGTPTFALIDELHAWKKRELWDVISTGMRKVPGTLKIVITTSGRGQENVAYEVIDYARKVARGDIKDPSMLPILFETPATADWRDEAVWHRVNPGLKHGFPDIEGLRAAVLEAEHRPGERDAFRQLHLNVWLDHATDPFVDMATYDEGAEKFELEDLEDEPCWLGVDLSSSIDLTVIVGAWKRDAGGYFVKAWFFIPEDNIRDRQELSGAPYVQWVEDKLVTATPGNTVDFRAVEDKIHEICARFDVREIAVDPHMARNTLNNLVEAGLPAVEMRQGSLTMMPALAELERAVVGRKLIHGGDPVLRFCFSNAEAQRNSLGHVVRLVKGQRWLSIDGAVAGAMAVARAAAGASNKSSYDSFEGDIEEWAYV